MYLQTVVSDIQAVDNLSQQESEAVLARGVQLTD